LIEYAVASLDKAAQLLVLRSIIDLANFLNPITDWPATE
jgi:hypothetical protein